MMMMMTMMILSAVNEKWTEGVKRKKIEMSLTDDKTFLCSRDYYAFLFWKFFFQRLVTSFLQITVFMFQLISLRLSDFLKFECIYIYYVFTI